MKLHTPLVKKFLTFCFAIVLASCLLIPGPSLAQNNPSDDLDIDGYFEQDGIDPEFFFGNKDEIKRDVINKANEANREDIQIKRDQELNPGTTTTTTTTTTVKQVTVTFSIQESGTTGGPIKVEVVGKGVLETSIVDTSSSRSITLDAGSSQSLKVSCLSASCDYQVDITSGASFTSPVTGSSTGFKSITSPTAETFVFLVNST